MRAIERCRTAALGGHLDACDRCGATRIAYNSCRNRHCPKCQSLARAKWLEAQSALLLPVGYFHVVFTLPHELNELILYNRRLLYELLFRAASQTLHRFGRDPRYLGAELAITAILHTWGQNLSQHVHLHCVVSGGGLSVDRERWIGGQRRFLFPVRALSKVFRGKYLDSLRRAVASGKLRLPHGLADPAAFADLLGRLRQRPWVVYAKRPFAGPKQVLAYLGRYTHRVAISNDRIVDFADNVVHFRWKDYAHGEGSKIMKLEATEFIRRFLLHVVPGHFMRIRHFGLLANRHRRHKLSRCRQLLGITPPDPPAAPSPHETMAEQMLCITGVDISRCPSCGQGTMTITEILAPQNRGPRFDSS